MSLILDALRKMELERKAKRQTSKEVRTEVLNYRGVAPAAEKTGVNPVTAVILTVIVTTACFFYFTKEQSGKSDPAKAVVIVKPEPLPVISLQPLPPTTKSIPAEVKSSTEQPGTAMKAEKTGRKTGDDEFIVSGIAWQEERSLRRAVINGVLVGEGAEILGAKVIEIRENRIRFSRGTELFEINHSAGSVR